MEARVVDNALQTQPDRDALLENRTEKVTFEFVVALRFNRENVFSTKSLIL